MEITEALDKIINAKKGKDVRQALHDGLQHCYNDATGSPESQAAIVQDVLELQEMIGEMEPQVIDCISEAEIDAIFTA